MLGEPVILSYGLTDEEIKIVQGNLPTKAYELIDVSDAPTDLIAVPSSAMFIRAVTLEKDLVEFLFDSYAQTDGCATHTAIWIGEPIPAKKMNCFFKYYNSFEEIREKLKYILLSIHKQTIKTVEFSNRISLALMILQEIRKHPGISTKALSIRLDINTRSVQRYINSLRMAGESIEYDMSQKGWQLLAGKSILLGDFWKDLS